MVGVTIPMRVLAKVYLRGLLLLLLLEYSACPLQAYADSPDAPGSEKAATVAIHRLALLFKNAQTLTFVCRIQSNTPDGRTDVIRGFAEKPNKFRIDEIINGQPCATVVSDGTTVYAYQISTAHFRRMTA